MLTAEIVIQIVLSTGIFLIVWFVVGNNLFKPYLALLDEREARTSGAEKEAAGTSEETVRKTAQLEDELRAGRAEGVATRDEYVRQAKKTAQEITDSASEAADLELEKNRHLIEELKANTRGDIPKEADKLAAVLVDRVLKGGSSHLIH